MDIATQTPEWQLKSVLNRIEATLICMETRGETK